VVQTNSPAPETVLSPTSDPTPDPAASNEVVDENTRRIKTVTSE